MTVRKDGGRVIARTYQMPGLAAWSLRTTRTRSGW